jgi:hypothetical protein
MHIRLEKVPKSPMQQIFRRFAVLNLDRLTVIMAPDTLLEWYRNVVGVRALPKMA